MQGSAASETIVSPRGRRGGSGLRLLLAVFVACLCLPAAAVSPDNLEYKVKAGYLFNFAKFVEWPPHTHASAQSPFVIGVLGEREPVGAIEEVLRAKSVFGRPLEIRPMDDLQARAGCHILFVLRSSKISAGEAVAAIGKDPVLLVGETESFAESGGMIEFVRQDDQFRLLLNLETVNSAGLKASAKLASVAKNVRSKRK